MIMDSGFVAEAKYGKGKKHMCILLHSSPEKRQNVVGFAYLTTILNPTNAEERQIFSALEYYYLHRFHLLVSHLGQEFVYGLRRRVDTALSHGRLYPSMVSIKPNEHRFPLFLLLQGEINVVIDYVFH